MDLQAQITELNHLLYLHFDKEEAVSKCRELMHNYEEGMKDATEWGLPVAPKKPREPRKPSPPKHVVADTKVHTKELMLLGYLAYLNKAVKKKKILKEAQETNERLDDEYGKQLVKYDKEHAKWEKDMEVYTDSYAKWQVAVKNKREENIEKYKKDNAGMLEQVKQLEAKIAKIEKEIAATTILSAADRNNKHLINSISLKLSTGRADSIMMALNMYDAEKRQEDQFRAQLQMDAFNRQMETDRRKRWEAEQERAQWSHNRQMEEYAKQTRDYERQQAKDLEEIRKAAERK